MRTHGFKTRLSLRNNEKALIVLCAPLGWGIGLIVVALHELVSWLHEVDFALPAGGQLSTGIGVDPVRLLWIPAAGGLLLGGLSFFGQKLRPRDIVDPIEANAIQGGRMSLTDSLRLVAATVLSNAAGASLGMEAAYSQMGAGALSFFGQSMNLRRNDLRIFVAAGAAAAIAAAFNAPLAGAFYGFELILGSYSPAALAQVAMAVLGGTLAVRMTIGVAPIFLVHGFSVTVNHWGYPLFVLLGVAAAALGIVTMRSATWSEALLRKLKIPRWLRPMIGGVAISAIALAAPQALGAGHGGIQQLFDASPSLLPLLLLLAAKTLASAVSVGSGFRGGLFSSSLYIGCLFGAAAGQGVVLITPSLSGQETLFMLVGMGAVAASIVGAPVTMMMLVLEVTGDFETTLAVLAGVVTSASITRYAFGYSFATWRFQQRGKPIRGAHDVGWIGDLTVDRLMRREARTVPQNTTLMDLRQQMPLGAVSRVFAVDETGRYVGLIELALAHDPDLDDAAPGLVAGDLATNRHDFLLPEMNIRAALNRFEDAELETMVVLADDGDRRIVGYVTEAFALRRYAQEMERHRSVELGERDLFAAGSVGQ
ncbi:MAG TPA: chloride channel protein [Candidatus Sulfotelmatobacter sp.]|jgi:CIC family chloride channel protein|nr:chloride channel protein [Candidatus Sulfotelmatobacter sp.]